MEEFLQVIKDYGAAIISAVSVGGVAAIATVVIKVKKVIDTVKEKMNGALKQRDNAMDALEATNKKYDEAISEMKNLTNEINELKNTNFERRK